MNYTTFKEKTTHIFEILRDLKIYNNNHNDTQNLLLKKIDRFNGLNEIIYSIDHLIVLLNANNRNEGKIIENRIYDYAQNNLIINKHLEYSGDEDTLSNFNQISECLKVIFELNLDALTIIKVLFGKHYNWILKNTDNLKNPNIISDEAIVEHFGDTINYLIIMHLFINDQKL